MKARIAFKYHLPKRKSPPGGVSGEPDKGRRSGKRRSWGRKDSCLLTPGWSVGEASRLKCFTSLLSKQGRAGCPCTPPFLQKEWPLSRESMFLPEGLLALGSQQALNIWIPQFSILSVPRQHRRWNYLLERQENPLYTQINKTKGDNKSVFDFDSYLQDSERRWV